MSSPKPWKWIGTRAHPELLAYLTSGDGGYVLVDVNGLEMSNDDAHLIAASPDLLAACKAAYGPIYKAAMESSDTTILVLLRDAIAKAEGRA